LRHSPERQFAAACRGRPAGRDDVRLVAGQRTAAAQAVIVPWDVPARAGASGPISATKDTAMLMRSCVILALLLGVLALANGAFMLYAPSAWYFAVPGVTTTGPFNQHFIRDIGLVFLFLGAAFLIGAARPQYRVVCWGGSTVWLLGHALFHY